MRKTPSRKSGPAGRGARDQPSGRRPSPGAPSHQGPSHKAPSHKGPSHKAAPHKGPSHKAASHQGPSHKAGSHQAPYRGETSPGEPPGTASPPEEIVAPAAARSRLADVDELEVTVEKLIAGGDGLARFEGTPLFVPRSAPGDRLRVKITERRPDYGRAEIIEILAPGPGRREPPCPHFETCGGCDLQHLDDALQSRLKADAARETLERLGRLELPATPAEGPALITGEAWGYRLRTQLHIVSEETRVRIGYHARGSHDLVAVDCCPILVPELEGALLSLSGRLAEEDAISRHLPHRLDLTAGGDGSLTAAPHLPELPRGEVSFRVGELTYAYDARTFFQAHRGLTSRLVEVAVGEGPGPGEGNQMACDLYGGVGLFALPLARHYRQVIVVEGDRVAARFARHNARKNHLDHVEVISQAVETWVRELPEGVDRVLVDPPRGGLARPVRQALEEKRPRRLTYVSCHAATLARDLAQLGALYRAEAVTFLDLFPQTGHIETVVQLVLR